VTPAVSTSERSLQFCGQLPKRGRRPQGTRFWSEIIATNGGTEFHAVAARKGESYETEDSNQGWTSQPEPQHHRSLTLKGHGPIPQREVMPRKFQTFEPIRTQRRVVCNSRPKSRPESFPATTTPSFGKSPVHPAIPRGTSCHERFKCPNPKENCMKLKTKIKAGRLAANHNPIVR
jgi:hypothetical protein